MERKSYSMLDIIKIPVKYSKGYGALLAFQKIIEGVIPSIQVLVTASFIDRALQIANGNTEPKNILLPIIVLVALIGYSWLSAQITKLVEVKLEFSLREKLRVDITEKRAKLKYKHIENQNTADLISRVSQEPEIQIKNAYKNVLSLLAILLWSVGLLFIVTTKIWWAGIAILVISIPLGILAVKGGKATYQASRDVSKNVRKYQYLREVLIGRESACERTLFGYTEKVNDKWSEQYEIARKVQFDARLRFFIKMKVGSLVTTVMSILIIMVLIKPVLEGMLSVGLFIAIFTGLLELTKMMSVQLTNHLKDLSKSTEYLRDLTNFVQLDESRGAIDLPSKEAVELDTLEFENVSFRYPGTDNYILNKLTFKIEKGMHYAFVGVNGAGKTTVIKLITGLYDEFEGEIRINGKSIREYENSELKSICSVVYQDFAKYFVSVKDNISMGNLNPLNSEAQEEKIDESIKLMNLGEAIEALPKKIQTPLGKIKSDGQDFSGGQWQRLAMARSIMSPASLRILDEPTAALDPISESKMYEEFEEISNGGTTIFISHRLGSTKLAKEILVLDKGTIIEQGSHEALMAADGVYAEMYESQRSWYL